MVAERTATKTNIHHSILIRYAKFLNHLSMKYHPIGQAIKLEIITMNKNSLEISQTILPIEAPCTFRSYSYLKDWAGLVFADLMA